MIGNIRRAREVPWGMSALRLAVLAAMAAVACDGGDAAPADPPPAAPTEETDPATQQALTKIDERLHALEVRLSKLEVATQAPASIPDHGPEIEALTKRLDALTNTLGTLDEGLAKLEGQVETLNAAAPAATVAATATEVEVEVEAEAESLTGVPECDAYVEKYTRCIDEKLPEAVRATSKKALETAVEAWKKAAATAAGREGLRTACETATEAVSAACGW